MFSQFHRFVVPLFIRLFNGPKYSTIKVTFLENCIRYMCNLIIDIDNTFLIRNVFFDALAAVAVGIRNLSSSALASLAAVGVKLIRKTKISGRQVSKLQE